MKGYIVIAGCLLLALWLVAIEVARYGALPSLELPDASTAPFDTSDTVLGKAIRPLVAAHSGLSGIYPLPDGRDAFAAREFLSRSAERTLDIRYYIWRNDVSGTLLFAAVCAAADRGVRVRLLLDDNNTAGLDPLLAALDSHPNIEVRLFNPFAIRGARWISYATDFSRLNRRMHNKSFTADNQATIVGGRNVGDEYFGATNGVLFADLDVLAVGPVVAEVSEDFDRYWFSGSSYPGNRVLPAVDNVQITGLVAAALRVERDPATVAYVNAIRTSRFALEWDRGTLVPVWAATRLVSDDPAKGLGLAATEAPLFREFREIIGESVSQVDIVSPYFVPTSAGLDTLIDLTKRGVRIRVLTNALEATDVPIVHAGYAKRRRALLQHGIALYELRRSSSDIATGEHAFGLGSSGSSLHAKTFSVDRSRVFIGSYNFDPRSAKLNTEMGIVIESPALAGSIEAYLSSRIPSTAYEVRLTDAEQLQWIERGESGLVLHDVEPGSTAWQRARVWLLSLLPIEWLL